MIIGQTELAPHPLANAPGIYLGRLDEAWCPELGGPEFTAWWATRPSEDQFIQMYGRRTALPRRQRAFGRDYKFSGQVSVAEPVPDWLAPLLGWARELEPRIDGLLVNWYDGALGERIGPHRDSTRGLVPNTPILTLSFGAARTFRFRPYGPTEGQGLDLTVEHGDVVVIPWLTNLAYTHAVPHFARDAGRRISVTLRAFA